MNALYKNSINQRQRILLSTLFPNASISSSNPRTSAISKYCIRTLPKGVWVSLQIDFPLILSHTSSLLRYNNVRNFSISSPAGSKIEIKRVFTMHRLLDEFEFSSLPVDVLLPSQVDHTVYHVSPVFSQLGKSAKNQKNQKNQKNCPRFHDLPSQGSKTSTHVQTDPKILSKTQISSKNLKSSKLTSKLATSSRHPALETLRGSANFDRIEHVESETQTQGNESVCDFDILNEEDFSRSVTDAIHVAEELQTGTKSVKKAKKNEKSEKNNEKKVKKCVLNHEILRVYETLELS